MERFLLRVNLSDRSFRDEVIPSEVLENHIGGKGLAAYYLYNELQPGTDPFSPENLIVFFIGPLTGILNVYSRHVVAAKSPLTNTFSDSYAGGWWGAELSKTKYTGVLIEGKADVLVYLKIDGQKVSIEDARHLAGKTPYEVDAEFNDFRVAAIGPAGEKLVRFSCIINDASKKGRTGVAGRGGLGAVMGSKNLKAIVIKGKQSEKGMIDPCYVERVKKVQKNLLEYIKTEVVPGMGLGGNLQAIHLTGEGRFLPVRNFREGSISRFAQVAEDAFREVTVGKNTCYLCPVACGVHIRAKIGPYEGLELDRIEYETVALNGPNCSQLDIGTIAKIGQLCNEYGVDTISIGNICAFIIECAEKGLVDYKLKDGDGPGQVRLVEMIGQRIGIGDILAEGLMRAARKLGLEKFAVEIKGLEIPGYDVRGPVGMALAYATSDRGGDHLRAWTIVSEVDSLFTTTGKAKLVKNLQDRNSALWCLIACDNIPANAIGDPAKFVGLSISGLEGIGWTISEEKFLEIGERIYNLTRLFNVREGFSRKDDQLPLRLKERREDTGWEIRQEDFDGMLDEYYSLRGWDKNGQPKKETLLRLGINENS
jgi:aldehyde:ferredoxin oxidoreductase